MLRPSLLDLLPSPGAAGPRPGAAVVVPSSGVAPAVPGKRRTHLGKSWHLYLNPFDHLTCLVALLSIFEGFGREVGSECAYTVPAMGAGGVWSGASIDFAAMFTAMRRFAEERAHRPINTFGRKTCFVTTAMHAEERPMIMGPFPAERLMQVGSFGHVSSQVAV